MYVRARRVLWWSTVIGNVLQILAARLGVVTGKNLAEVWYRWRSVCLPMIACFRVSLPRLSITRTHRTTSAPQHTRAATLAELEDVAYV